MRDTLGWYEPVLIHSVVGSSPPCCCKDVHQCLCLLSDYLSQLGTIPIIEIPKVVEYEQVSGESSMKKSQPVDILRLPPGREHPKRALEVIRECVPTVRKLLEAILC